MPVRLAKYQPEKWESLTRRGRDIGGDNARLALIMIDEVPSSLQAIDISSRQVHFLRDTRGATLEVVVSRMKARDPSTRIVALSATVS